MRLYPAAKHYLTKPFRLPIKRFPGNRKRYFLTNNQPLRSWYWAGHREVQKAGRSERLIFNYCPIDCRREQKNAVCRQFSKRRELQKWMLLREVIILEIKRLLNSNTVAQSSRKGLELWFDNTASCLLNKSQDDAVFVKQFEWMFRHLLQTRFGAFLFFRFTRRVEHWWQSLANVCKE